jgi:putative transcriptional regulator
VNTGVIFDTQMKFALNNRLAECRAAKGINKSQLAMRLKKSRAYVTRLERGDISPSVEVALGLARYFARPVEYIFELREPGDVSPHGLNETAGKPISRPPSVAPGKPTINTTETKKGKSCN